MSRVRPVLDQLPGARILRVDGPDPDRTFALTLDAGGAREVLVLQLDGPARGIGLLPDRPRGEPASAFVRLLRKHLQGSRVRGLWRRSPRGAHLVLERGGTAAGLALVDLAGPGGLGLVLWGGEHPRVLGGLPRRGLGDLGWRPGAVPPEALPEDGSQGDAEPWADLVALRRAGQALVAETGDRDTQLRRTALRRRVVRTRDRLRRKVRAIAGDAARAERVPELRRRASALLASPGAEPDARGKVEVTDWEADPPAPLSLQLDPGQTVAGQGEAWFRLARRLERGAALASERLAATSAALAEVEALLEAIDGSEERSVVEALEARWVALGVDRGQGSSSGTVPNRKRDAPRLPYRRYRGAGGREIRVGKGAADNDELTLRHARPQDLWLHARSVRGAHVVVPLDRGESIPPGLLADAATLAAHFSEARGEALAEVQHAERRHVRKPRGFPPGAVRVEREKTFTVRVDGRRLRELLDSEKLPGP